MSTAETARFALRASATVGATAAYLSRFELAALRHDRTEKLANHVPRWARRLLQIYGVTVLTEGPVIGDGGSYPGVSDNGVGRVFVLNHRSAMDVFISAVRLLTKWKFQMRRI